MKKARIRYANLTAQNINCSKEDFRALANDLSLATDQLLVCLQKYNRYDDADKLKKMLLEKKVSMQCVDNPGDYLARAHTGLDPLAPGMSVQVNRFRTDVTLLRNSFMQTLAHESIHWLGYYHYADVDWAYIAEFCCLPSEKSLAGVQAKACELFRYQNKSDFFTPSYVRDFNSLMISIGLPDIGFGTVLKSAVRAASVYGQQALSADRVDQILAAPVDSYLSDLNFYQDGNEFTYSKKSSLIYAMILTHILSHSNFEDIALLNHQRHEALSTRFLNSSVDIEKRDALILIGDFLESVIRDQSLAIGYRLKELLQKNKAVCGSFDDDETDIINRVLRRLDNEAVDKISSVQDKAYFSIEVAPAKSERANLLKTLSQFCKPKPRVQKTDSE